MAENGLQEGRLSEAHISVGAAWVKQLAGALPGMYSIPDIEREVLFNVAERLVEQGHRVAWVAGEQCIDGLRDRPIPYLRREADGTLLRKTMLVLFKSDPDFIFMPNIDLGQDMDVIRSICETGHVVVTDIGINLRALCS